MNKAEVNLRIIAKVITDILNIGFTFKTNFNIFNAFQRHTFSESTSFIVFGSSTCRHSISFSKDTLENCIARKDAYLYSGGQ